MFQKDGRVTDPVELARLIFNCSPDGGSTDLTVTVENLTDATYDQDIAGTTARNGEVDCETPAGT